VQFTRPPNVVWRELNWVTPPYSGYFITRPPKPPVRGRRTKPPTERFQADRKP
jgi:hypothetical protein